MKSQFRTDKMGVWNFWFPSKRLFPIMLASLPVVAMLLGSYSDGGDLFGNEQETAMTIEFLIVFVYFLVRHIVLFFRSKKLLQEGFFSVAIETFDPHSIPKAKINWHDLFKLKGKILYRADYERGLKDLRELVPDLKNDWTNKKKLIYALVLVLGLYLIDSSDVDHLPFLLGVEIIICELVTIFLHLFSKRPVEFLEKNPRWPEYLELLKSNPVLEEEEAPVEIDRYSRET